MNSLDAIELLTDDHEKVKTLFEEFDAVAGDDSSLEEKAAIVQQICQELVVHTAIEEEIFYPAARAAIDDDDLIDEAIVEHASASEAMKIFMDTAPCIRPARVPKPDWRTGPGATHSNKRD